MNKIFTIFLGSFVFGVFIRSFLDFGPAFAGLFILLGAVLVLVYFFQGKKKIIIFASLLFFSTGLGIFRYDISSNSRENIFFESNIDQAISFKGIVSDEPDYREDNTRYIIEVGDGVRILVYGERYPEFNYGDEVGVKGKLKKPENFSGDFNWPLYLAKDNIFYEMFYPKMELISSGNGFILKEGLFAVKRRFLQNISRVIPSPHSALLGGLVVGSKEAMGKELLDDFRKTGVIHIVVLSGYNVTIVVLSMMRIFSFLPQVFGIALGSFGIILFALLTGASATIVRSSIMALIVVLAKTTGRIYNITIALFIAGFLMIFHNPKILVFDPSFQLSFLATVGLIYFSPFFERKFKFIPEKWNIREVAIATLATQIFVLPFLLYKIGEISIVSLPVNLLILIFVPVTMFFGFLAGFFGFLGIIISTPFAWVTYLLLEYELKVVDIFSSIPFASIKLQVPLWIMFLIYVIYAFIIFKFIFGRQVLKESDFDIIDDI
ncbi:MAG: ComEC family competence protein [Parcubacteria group bacterium]|nr:ComEC family competence protein [Parcubacteria group bacterium]MCR4342959.1 ComEC family competence protein [Patescibacteria group bacterium]